jgi:phosphoserine phosphatase RsbU/P
MMATNVTLIVAEERGPRTGELEQALHEDGVRTRSTSPAELTLRPDLCADVDLVLVSATVGLQQVAMIDRQLAGFAAPPALIVYPERDLHELESCVRGGFDYVVPPFLPALLRSRVASCRERSQLAEVVEEMAAAARLQEYEREMSIAHEIQSGFLPDQLPTRGGWDFGARFLPARQVAGDFYDGFELVNGRRLGFVVADVCDKGVGAALFMALIRTLLRHTAQHTGVWNLTDDDNVLPVDGAATGIGGPVLSAGAGPLMHAVVGTNRYMTRNHLQQGYFATLFFGVLDPVSGALLYINGGHNPPVLLRASGERLLLPPTGPAVGVLPDGAYYVGRAELSPGDMLLVYTDGVVEARDGAGRQYTMEGLLALLDEPIESATELLDRIEDSLRAHAQSTEQFDDITMLALRRTAD